MVRGIRLVPVLAAAALVAMPLLAQAPIVVAPKKGATDTFTVKVGSAAPVTAALQRVAEYPAQKLKKSCQDPLYRGLIVSAAWTLADLVPGAGSVAAVYDDVQLVERMGYPCYPLATVQGEGFQVTLHWVTPLKLRALSHCHDQGQYDWWYMEQGGPDAKRAVVLIDVLTMTGREWWVLEKCGDAPTTARKLEAPGSEADLNCPPAGK